MAINVQVSRSNNENGASVLRRFVKKVRGAGFLQVVRGNRYYTRKQSKLRTKNSRLTSLERFEKFNEMKKMGQVIEK